MKEDVLEILLQNKGKPVSGTEIGRQLHMTRAAVWKDIKALQDMGYRIAAATNKGYCLSSEQDILNASEIRQYLHTKTLGQRIDCYSVTDSTNLRAKQAAQNKEPAGYVAVADSQTNGRGRFGRTFYSPDKTGIYMSVLLRPDLSISETALITAAVSVCVAEAVEALTDCAVQIKWVNDLFVGGKKICGILTEAAVEFETRRAEYVVVGIGVNLKTDQMPSELQKIAGGIADHCTAPNRCRLIAEILNRMEHMLDHFSPETFIDAYRRRSNVIGKRVSIHQGTETAYGRALDIDDQARLIVKTDTGEIRALNSGEISCKVL